MVISGNIILLKLIYQIQLYILEVIHLVIVLILLMLQWEIQL